MREGVGSVGPAVLAGGGGQPAPRSAVFVPPGAGKGRRCASQSGPAPAACTETACRLPDVVVCVCSDFRPRRRYGARRSPPAWQRRSRVQLRLCCHGRRKYSTCLVGKSRTHHSSSREEAPAFPSAAARSRPRATAASNELTSPRGHVIACTCPPRTTSRTRQSCPASHIITPAAPPRNTL